MDFGASMKAQQIQRLRKTSRAVVTNQKPNHNLRLSVIDDPAQELTLVAGVKFIPANHGKARSDGDHLDVHHCYFTYNTITLFID